MNMHGPHWKEILPKDRWVIFHKPVTHKQSYKQQVTQSKRTYLPIGAKPMSESTPTPESITSALELVTQVNQLTSNKFKQNTVNLFLAALECGMPPKKACKLVGISPETLKSWIAQGENGISPYKEFLNSLEMCVSSMEKWCLENIKAAADFSQNEVVITHIERSDGSSQKTTVTKPKKGDWKASAYLLERLDPESYGKQNVNQNPIVNNTQIVVQLPSNGRNAPKEYVDIQKSK